MQTFHYQAINQAGLLRDGWMPATDIASLAQRLHMQGLELLVATPRRLSRWGNHHLTAQQIIEFCVQLAQLLRAGVPLIQALEALAEHVESPMLSVVLLTLQQEIEGGQPLSQAMLAQKQVFPTLACHLVAAGEHTGQLPAVLSHLATALQWQTSLQAQTKRGLVYPAMLAVMVLLAAVVMLTFLVPQMAGFLSSLGQGLPWSTRALIWISDLVIAHGFAMLLGCIVMCGLAYAAVAHLPSVAWWWHQRLLHAPVVGKLIQQLMLARLCRFLGLMYRTGIPLIEALHLCQPLMRHPVMTHALSEVIQSIQSGKTLAQSVAETGRFPPLMVRMMGIGETTGALDDTLSQLSDFYDQEVQARLKALLSLLEPVLTMVLGAMLMLLMAAVMLPIYDSFSQLKY